MRALLIATMVLLAACTSVGGTPATPPKPSVVPTAVSTSSTSVPIVAVTSEPEVPPCLTGDGQFTQIGIVGTVGRGIGDASLLSELRLSTFGGPDDVTCERLTLLFATNDSAPATMLGLTGIEVLRTSNVVRISLSGAVAATAIADVWFDSPLVSRAYVVRDDFDALFVDVHLAADASARADLFSSPARLVLDLQPIDGPGLPPARVADSAVVVSSVDGGFGYPIRISGYVRSRSSGMTVELTDGVDRAEQTITSSDYPWRSFNADFATGPTGDVVLRVGDLEMVIPIG